MSPQRATGAFTLIELLVVIAIIGALTTIYLVNVAGKSDKANVAAAKAQLIQLENAVIEYQTDHGQLPSTLRDLVERPSHLQSFPKGGYLRTKKVPTDPWGHEFRLLLTDDGFEIRCLGADGREGGSDANADLNSRD